VDSFACNSASTKPPLTASLLAAMAGAISMQSERGRARSKKPGRRRGKAQSARYPPNPWPEAEKKVWPISRTRKNSQNTVYSSELPSFLDPPTPATMACLPVSHPAGACLGQPAVTLLPLPPIRNSVFHVFHCQKLQLYKATLRNTGRGRVGTRRVLVFHAGSSRMMALLCPHADMARKSSLSARRRPRTACPGLHRETGLAALWRSLCHE
jgi:hypothetical protein